MLSSIAYFQILGKPLILYLGVITFLSFMTTATLGLLIYRGKNIPFKIHPTMAGISILLGITHGTLALSIYFQY
ncbi:hypothetical protein [Methanobacterium sp. SMA-27]|uniref:hypothetical protein n=1 Tax=Methanobacterium sp. SMA-27 TaxID=1495336 RepID=UPI00064EF386|nr:hypothetical protein [Methanobacterium sp. SMA-27]